MIVCCCRCCCKKEKRDPPKRKSQRTSAEHHDFYLPLLRRAPVQPRPTGRKEIKELGKLDFSLKYDYRRSQLNVKIIRGVNFSLLSSSNVSFTYVVVELRPFSQKYEAKAQTRYVRNNVSPTFNDTIKYQIQAEDLPGQILFLSVYDINHLSSHDLIGCVKIKIDGKTIISGSERFYSERLKWEDEISEHNGELLVGLCWKEKNEILEIAIQEASGLKIMDQDKLTSSK